MTAFCPNCGHNLERGKRLVDGNFTYAEDEGLRYKGEMVAISKTRHDLCGMVMSGGGKIVRRETIAGRLYPDILDIGNRISVDLSMTNRVFTRMGLRGPIASFHGYGLAWCGEGDEMFRRWTEGVEVL